MLNPTYQFILRSSSHNGSTHFTNFTYSVIVEILVSVVSGEIGTVVGSVVGSIAGVILNDHIPTVYYERYVYYFRETSVMVLQVAANTSFYYDSNHDTYLGFASETWEGQFPW